MDSPGTSLSAAPGAAAPRGSTARDRPGAPPGTPARRAPGGRPTPRAGAPFRSAAALLALLGALPLGCAKRSPASASRRSKPSKVAAAPAKAGPTPSSVKPGPSPSAGKAAKAPPGDATKGGAAPAVEPAVEPGEYNSEIGTLTVRSATPAALVFDLLVVMPSAAAHVGQIARGKAARAPGARAYVFRGPDCRLTLTPTTAGGGVDVSQRGACAFGAEVDASGAYRK